MIELSMNISVIIPNYNRTVSLRRAIDSVIRQTFAPSEIIVVDDCSTIDPIPYIDHFKSSKIVLHKLSANRGAAVARNQGAEIAKGSFIAFLDSDDEWHSEFLESRATLHSNSDALASYGACVIKLDDKVVERPPVRDLRPNEKMVNYVLSGNLRAVTSSLFVQRDAFRQVKFDPSMVPHEDYVFNIEFSKRFKIICDPTRNTIYHMSKNSLSAHLGDRGVEFLKRYKNDISFKLLLFYVIRKTHLAYSQNQPDIVKSYKTILSEQLYRSNMTLRFASKIFFLFPRISSSLFSGLVDKIKSTKNVRSILAPR